MPIFRRNTLLAHAYWHDAYNKYTPLSPTR